MRRAAGRCERCGAGRYLILHHLNYDRVGAERLEDVELVCMRCHKLSHFATPELVPPRWTATDRPMPGRRRRVAAIVKAIRLGTVCEHCGDPGRRIEWHHPDHPQHPERRVPNLVTHGPLIGLLETVIDEIDRCTAVCRSCHMQADGRSDRLRDNRHAQGERNPCARLTKDAVMQIRALHAADPAVRRVELAHRFGVSPATVSHVILRRTWT